MLFKLVLTLVLLWAGAAGAAPRPIMVLGDSLSAAYGIELDRGWVNLLRQRLLERGFDHPVVNASISGDTTAGGLSRLPEALRRVAPGIVVIELGGNDGLRGLALEQTRENLARMIDLSREAGARVLLLGMMMPPNFGRPFTERFLAMYRDLAADRDVPLVPFFLEGVADDPSLMQADAIHPNAEGQSRMLDNVWPALLPLLDGE